MRFSVLRENGRNLARGCAILVIAGAAAGCSSQVARFSDGIDGISTASTANQRAIINNQAPQPFPGDSVSAAPVDGSYSRSVARSSLEPVSAQALPPVASAPAPALAPASARPMRTAAAPMNANVDRSTTTGTVAAARKPETQPFKQAQPDAPRVASAGEGQGWSAIGGSVTTVKDGETLYGLARRHGVPAHALMEANGLNADSGLKIGQKIIIPARGHSNKAVAAADAKRQIPADRVPAPTSAPAAKVAVLPQQPKVKDGRSVAAMDANNPKLQPKDGKAPAQVASAAKPVAKDSYTVQSGDTLSAIARKTGVGVVALKKANGMNDGLLRVGQTLKIPGGEAAAVAEAKPATVDPVKTASTPPQEKATPTQTLASYTPPRKAEKVIEQAEDQDIVAPDSTGIGKMRWPVRGRVISSFGGPNGDGIDIAVPKGTPVKAAENGVVIYAGNGLKEFGNTVLVRHENGLVTVYGHASSLEVKRGQKVKRGQEIALSGMSGTTDSPKLHFEVRKNSAPVDPSSYLE